MPSSHFDYIVIGAGSMGAAACFHLAARGCRVLGIEQFAIPHEQGSHTGWTRIIRKAYFEHPDYVPLLQRAYRNIRLMEARCGQPLYLQTGLLYAGPPGHHTLGGVRQSAALHDIPLENLSEEEARARFPQFCLPARYEVLFEPEAGLLLAEAVIRAYAQEARRAGAVLHEQEHVRFWALRQGMVSVQTDRAEYTCHKLVVAAGAWSGWLIPGIGDKLNVTRQVLAWFKPVSARDFAVGQMPCWLMAIDGVAGSYYGFPSLPASMQAGPEGIKIARHYPGQPCQPDAVERRISEADVAHLQAFANQYFGGAHGAPVEARTCLYSNSPDEHFVIDILPHTEGRVCAAWGFSGHGFKFVPVMGEILADLAMQGRTPLPAGFLEAKRLGMA